MVGLISYGRFQKAEPNVFKAIFDAVEHHKDTAITQLGDELIQKLDDLYDNRQYENQLLETIAGDYKQCKDILKFK